MSKVISEIEGIGSAYAKRLQAAGVKSVEDLLTYGAMSKSRRDLSVNTGLPESMILNWVNMADLFRIKGIGKQFSELLVESGVDTVVELATRNPENLYRKLILVNNMRKLTKMVPSLPHITKFIEEAKTLDKIVYH